MHNVDDLKHQAKDKVLEDITSQLRFLSPMIKKDAENEQKKRYRLALQQIAILDRRLSTH